MNNDFDDVLTMNQGKFDIEKDMNTAFINSQLGRDVHLWIYEKDRLTICEPHETFTNFGMALIGIHKHIKQKVVFHNQIDKERNIQIICSATTEQSSKMFYVPTDEIVLRSKEIMEIDIVFSPPNEINTYELDYDIKLDHNVIKKGFHVPAKVVRVDVELSSNIIDFGYIPSNRHEPLENQLI
ncbi:unnamed protein product [Didymodactylos carnosus]|uniref:Uncharacterized protein n=1 Tax=Didymodactylos carnosus TaxID=1234261 RepID=A0A814VHQ6_9BILA|nr:unnamed protein product [Didymodactylos carnosus]CAF1351218.1 unnamed protein product [Didymodactylos carnosus]CAF3951547.1 unnamed protein product [Didymodactylos carnosus]CAF4161717.1 unnamed protein product [Didymodactylos carnosus]